MMEQVKVKSKRKNKHVVKVDNESLEATGSNDVRMAHGSSQIDIANPKFASKNGHLPPMTSYPSFSSLNSLKMRQLEEDYKRSCRSVDSLATQANPNPANYPSFSSLNSLKLRQLEEDYKRTCRSVGSADSLAGSNLASYPSFSSLTSLKLRQLENDYKTVRQSVGSQVSPASSNLSNYPSFSSLDSLKVRQLEQDYRRTGNLKDNETACSSSSVNTDRFYTSLNSVTLKRQTDGNNAIGLCDAANDRHPDIIGQGFGSVATTEDKSSVTNIADGCQSIAIAATRVHQANEMATVNQRKRRQEADVKRAQDLRRQVMQKAVERARIANSQATLNEAYAKFYAKEKEAAVKEKDEEAAERKKQFDAMMAAYIASPEFEAYKKDTTKNNVVSSAPLGTRNIASSGMLVFSRNSAAEFVALTNKTQTILETTWEGGRVNISPLDSDEEIGLTLMTVCWTMMQKDLSMLIKEKSIIALPMEVLQLRYKTTRRFDGEILWKEDPRWSCDVGIITESLEQVENNIVGISYSDKKWFLFKLCPRLKILTVFRTHLRPQMANGIQLLKQTCEKITNGPWTLKCEAGPSSKIGKGDNAMAALLNFEYEISDDDAFVGVKTFKDFRQKLKWNLIRLGQYQVKKSSETDALRDRIKELEAKLELEEASNQARSGESKSDYLLRLLKTPIEEILATEPVHQLDEKFVACNVCFDPNKSNKMGKFLLPTNGLEGSQVTNRRKTLIDHLTSPQHMEKLSGTISVETYAAGMNLARSSYHAIKNCLGQKAYEATVVCDAAKSVKVGSKNHSTYFVSQFTRSVAGVLRERFREMMAKQLPATNQASPIVVVADKYTPNRETLHIIGIIAIVDGKLKDFLLNVNEVPASDGLGLAKDILRVLLEFFSMEELRFRLAGGAYDGQYIKLNVPRHLMNLLDIDEEQRELYTFNWDTAHVIEIAGKHAREQRPSGGTGVIGVAWICDVVTIVQKIGSKFKWGKSWLQLREMFEESSGESKRPLRFKNFSQTRFTAYFYDFLKAFAHNFVAVYKALEADVKSKQELSTVRNVNFVLGLTFLMDMYNEIKLASEKCQKVEILPWQLESVINELQLSLETMEKVLRDETFWPICPQLRNFNSAVNEFLSVGSYKGMKLERAVGVTRASAVTGDINDPKDREAVIDTNRRKFAEHISTFTGILDKKFKDSRGLACKSLGQVFGVKDLLTAGVCRDSLKQLHALYSKSDYFSLPSFEQFEREHELFLSVVRNEFKDKEITIESEYQFFMDIMSRACDFECLARVIAHSCVRSSCESITESMGSQVANILNGRARLSNEMLNQEAFIVHNGPNSGPQCDQLLVRSLDNHFGGRSNWNFQLKGAKEEGQDGQRSKVLSRFNNAESRIHFND